MAFRPLRLGRLSASSRPVHVRHTLPILRPCLPSLLRPKSNLPSKSPPPLPRLNDLPKPDRDRFGKEQYTHPFARIASKIIPNITRHVMSPSINPNTGKPKASLYARMKQPTLNSTKFLGDPVESFRSSLTSGKAHALAEPYRAIVESVKKTGDVPIRLDELRRAVLLVSRSRDEHMWALLESMFDDIHRIFHTEPTGQDHRALVNFLAHSPTPRAAFPRLETIPLDIDLGTEDFNVVMEGLARVGDWEALRSAMDQLENLQLEPNLRTYHLLLQGTLSSHHPSYTSESGEQHPGSSPATDSPGSPIANSPSYSASSTSTDVTLSTSSFPPALSQTISSQISTILSEISQANFTPNSHTYALIVQGLHQLGDSSNLDQYLPLLHSTLESEGSSNTDTLPWNVLVSLAATNAPSRSSSASSSASSSSPLDAALSAVSSMNSAGLETDAATMSAILSSPHVLLPIATLSQTKALVNQLEDALDLDLDATHYGILIDRALHSPGRITEASQGQAMEVYQYAISQGVQADVEMVLPLLRSYCVPENGGPADSRAALDLYRDLLKAEAAHHAVTAASSPTTASPSSSPSISPPSSISLATTNSSPSSTSLTESSPPPELETPVFHSGPTAEVYDLLLTAITADTRLTNHDAAWPLLADMSIRGVRFDAPTTSYHIRRFMNFAQSHKDAFAVYDKFYNTDPRSLAQSEDDYLTVVKHFIYSDYPKTAAPSPDLVANFITDMRRAGYENSQRVFVTLLTHYGRISYSSAAQMDRKSNQKIMDQMEKGINWVVGWSRLDPFIPHDVLTLNSFMNAQMRTGQIRSVYGTWLEISESKDPNVALNNASVSIMMDAIGLHLKADSLLWIWKWLRAGQFPLSLDNWNAYIENLLRNGFVQKAHHALITEMCRRTGSPPAPAPTVETIRIFRRWMKVWEAHPDNGPGKAMGFRRQLKNAVPDLWAQIEHEEEGFGDDPAWLVDEKLGRDEDPALSSPDALRQRREGRLRVDGPGTGGLEKFTFADRTREMRDLLGPPEEPFVSTREREDDWEDREAREVERRRVERMLETAGYGRTRRDQIEAPRGIREEGEEDKPYQRIGEESEEDAESRPKEAAAGSR